jgi:4-amino-4-deoxy-L-arabinose transferase-like glycosyltransferase
VGGPGDASADRSPRACALGAALLLALAAGLRLWGLDAGLPNVRTRPDEIEVLRQTALPARGEMRLEWSVYPNAYVYLTWLWGEAALRAGQAAGGPTDAGYAETLARDPARILLLARALSAAAGIATVGLLVAVARRPLGDAVALGAGLLLATSFLHARDSHFVKPEALLGLGVVLALGAMLPLAREATPARGALAGLAVGVAAAAKYPGAALLVPAWIAAAWGSPARGWRRLAGTPAAAVAAAAAALFLATSPQLLVDPATRAAVLRIPGIVFPQLFPELLAGATELANPAFEGPGPSPYAGPGALGTAIYHARFSLWYGAGRAATLLAPLAVAWGLASRSPLPTLAALVCAVWFAMISLSPVQLARYATPILAPLFLLEAGLLAGAARRFAPRAPRAAFAAAIALVAAEPLASALAHDRILARPDTRVLASEWMRRNLPVGAGIAVHGTRFWPWGEPELPPRARRVRAELDIASLVAAGASHLVVHEHPLFWSSPDAGALAALAPHLRLVAELVPFAADADPVFETADAYYAPFAGFRGVERAGPAVRIYELGSEAHRRPEAGRL